MSVWDLLYCLTGTGLSTEGRCVVLPVGGAERVSNHHVHRLPVTSPYAPAVGLLIMSVCDSHTAKVVRTRRLGREEGVNSLFMCVTEKESKREKRQR